MSDIHARFMAHALRLGRRQMGRTWPNPAVGCVIVKDGRIVGRGWTQAGGRPHAEPQALAQAGALARGADVYVTLEPCSHYGKTLPCADALIAAGVARVFVAIGDDDPRVGGTGIARLRQAGIEVPVGTGADAAVRDHAGFLSRVRTGRPLVALKLASSFDGRIATATGESQWITGPQARRAVHALRARYDAVMVGGGTARADNPTLTVRGLGALSQPVRIVISRKLDLPQAGALAKTAADAPLWLCHGPDASAARRAAWEGLGATLIPCGLSGRQVDLGAALQTLGDHGLTRIFCEGGGALAASLLSAGLVDRLYGFTAGVALGAEGTPSLGAMGLEALADAPRFVLQDIARLGGDVLHVWERNTFP